MEKTTLQDMFEDCKKYRSDLDKKFKTMTQEEIVNYLIKLQDAES